jgi:hypothetical protein
MFGLRRQRYKEELNKQKYQHEKLSNMKRKANTFLFQRAALSWLGVAPRHDTAPCRTMSWRT